MGRHRLPSFLLSLREIGPSAPHYLQEVEQLYLGGDVQNHRSKYDSGEQQSMCSGLALQPDILRLLMDTGPYIGHWKPLERGA